MTHLFGEPAWYEQANCATADPELFYPERAGTITNYLPAKSVCRNCPVRLECLKEGIEEEYGCWGGLNPDERHALRKGITASPHKREFLLARAAMQLTHPLN